MGTTGFGASGIRGWTRRRRVGRRGVRFRRGRAFRLFSVGGRGGGEALGAQAGRGRVRRRRFRGDFFGGGEGEGGGGGGRRRVRRGGGRVAASAGAVDVQRGERGGARGRRGEAGRAGGGVGGMVGGLEGWRVGGLEGWRVGGSERERGPSEARVGLPTRVGLLLKNRRARFVELADADRDRLVALARGLLRVTRLGAWLFRVAPVLSALPPPSRARPPRPPPRRVRGASSPPPSLAPRRARVPRRAPRRPRRAGGTVSIPRPPRLAARRSPFLARRRAPAPLSSSLTPAPSRTPPPSRTTRALFFAARRFRICPTP